MSDLLLDISHDPHDPIATTHDEMSNDVLDNNTKACFVTKVGVK